MKKKIIKILNKNFSKKITCLTAYSSSIANILDGNVDMILIGDSLGSTLYGMKNTQDVTLDMMKMHGRASIKNIKKSISIIDMPFNTYNTKTMALKNAKSLLKFTKAKMLKIEITSKKLEIVNFLNKHKINVIAHIGVTPQSYKNFKKIRALGKNEKQLSKLVKLSIDAEKAGAKAILLECITENTAKKIQSAISIPTIGIGASKYCDGQVIVFDDLINLGNKDRKPKFVKTYMDFKKLVTKAINKFDNDVKLKKFPSKQNTYF